MTTGRALLDMARGMAPEPFERVFGYGILDDIHNITDRPALIVALMTQLRPDDLQLVRRLTLFELDHVRQQADYCDQSLLACCWLLFRGGMVSDALLVWRAKKLGFLPGAMIDSALLAPAGPRATLAMAETLGFKELAHHMRIQAGPELEDDISYWQHGTYWGQIPSADHAREDLARWITGS
ncbi:hypothetical protein [Luteococcus peritonei]|uniref:Uncharacterized protein n=1 Tax=Luteococcus peritonei TaxID=88874 RepID=A0ABW4RU26_9ACTN